MKNLFDELVKKLNDLSKVVNTPIDTSAQEINMILKDEVESSIISIYKLLGIYQFQEIIKQNPNDNRSVFNNGTFPLVPSVEC